MDGPFEALDGLVVLTSPLQQNTPENKKKVNKY
jgi:hypothetical protein